ncbi:hypothetical protein GGI43DRAFT_301105 [Trichoderma evansii]
MKAIRKGMKEQGKDPSDVTFHILIPSWYNIAFTDPLHFPDELLPLRLVGPRYDGGKPLVSFVLPHQQRALTLQAVGNNFEEKPLSRDSANNIGVMTAMSLGTGAMMTGGFLGELAVVGLGIAAASPLAPLVVLSMAGGGIAAGILGIQSIGEGLMDSLSHERARVLGSDRELGEEEEKTSS